MKSRADETFDYFSCKHLIEQFNIMSRCPVVQLSHYSQCPFTYLRRRREKNGNWEKESEKSQETDFDRISNGIWEQIIVHFFFLQFAVIFKLHSKTIKVPLHGPNMSKQFQTIRLKIKESRGFNGNFAESISFVKWTSLILISWTTCNQLKWFLDCFFLSSSLFLSF